MDDPDIWNNYPPELVEQAQQSDALANQQLLLMHPSDPDPYNYPLATVILRWWARKTGQ